MDMLSVERGVHSGRHELVARPSTSRRLVHSTVRLSTHRRRRLLT